MLIVCIMICVRDLEQLFDCSYRICRMFVKKYFILKFDFLYKFENCVQFILLVWNLNFLYYMFIYYVIKGFQEI